MDTPPPNPSSKLISKFQSLNVGKFPKFYQRKEQREQAYIEGQDDRVKDSTDQYPNSSIGLIIRYLKVGDTIMQMDKGTGSLIGDNFVLTCSHNIFKKPQGWKRNVEIDDIDRLQFILNPIGKQKKVCIVKPHQIKYYQEYVHKLKQKESDKKVQNIQYLQYDFALLILNEHLEEDYGTLDLMFLHEDSKEKENQLSGICKKLVEICGYPGQVEVKGQKVDGDIFKCSNQKQIYLHNNKLIIHQISTSPGQSGSPIYWKQNQQRYHVFGVHVYGSADQANKKLRNVAVLLDQQKLDKLNQWVGQYESSNSIHLQSKVILGKHIQQSLEKARKEQLTHFQFSCLL